MSDMTVKDRLHKIRTEPDIIPISEIPYGLFNRIGTHIRRAEVAARLRALDEAANHLVNSAAGFHCPSKELLGHFKLAEDHIRTLMDKLDD